MESAGAFNSDGGGQADQLDESVKNSASNAKAQNVLSADKDASNTMAASTARQQKVLFIADQDGFIVRVDYDTEETAEPSTDKDASNTKAACIARQQKMLFIADQDGCIVRVDYDTEETAEPSTDKDNTISDCTVKEQRVLFSADQNGRIARLPAYTTEEIAEPNAISTSSGCTTKEQDETSSDRDASIAKTACIATTQTESSTSEHGRVVSRAVCTAGEMTTEPSVDKGASFNTIVFVEMEEELFSTSGQDARATSTVCNTEEMTGSSAEQGASVTKAVCMGEALKKSSDRQESSAAMTPGCVVKPQTKFSTARGDAMPVASNTHAAGAPKASEFHTIIPVTVCAASATNRTANVNVFGESSRVVTKQQTSVISSTGDNSKQQQQHHELKPPHAQLPLRQIQEPEVQAKKERVPCLFTCKICEQVP
jgi:hypothetical protein